MHLTCQIAIPGFSAEQTASLQAIIPAKFTATIHDTANAAPERCLGPLKPLQPQESPPKLVELQEQEQEHKPLP